MHLTHDEVDHYVDDSEGDDGGDVDCYDVVKGGDDDCYETDIDDHDGNGYDYDKGNNDGDAGEYDGG